MKDNFWQVFSGGWEETKASICSSSDLSNKKNMLWTSISLIVKQKCTRLYCKPCFRHKDIQLLLKSGRKYFTWFHMVEHSIFLLHKTVSSTLTIADAGTAPQKMVIAYKYRLWTVHKIKKFLQLWVDTWEALIYM